MKKRKAMLSVTLIVVFLFLCQFGVIRAASTRSPSTGTLIDGLMKRFWHEGFALGGRVLEFIADWTLGFSGRMLSGGGDVRSLHEEIAEPDVCLWLINGVLVIYGNTGVDYALERDQRGLGRLIHRLEVKCEVEDRPDVMVILQPNYGCRWDGDPDENTGATLSALISWEYQRGSYIHLLIDNSKQGGETAVFYERTLDDD
jgi:hypothetical protein